MELRCFSLLLEPSCFHKKRSTQDSCQLWTPRKLVIWMSRECRSHKGKGSRFMSDLLISNHTYIANSFLVRSCPDRPLATKFTNIKQRVNGHPRVAFCVAVSALEALWKQPRRSGHCGNSATLGGCLKFAVKDAIHTENQKEIDPWPR